jgi:site-specific DNA recombinase
VADEGHSGAVGVRPGLDEIMALAEAGEVDIVLAKKRNRFFRSRYWRLAYERDLEELGVSLVALDDTGNRFADAVNDEFADWYREEVAKNTAAGRMQKAREGKLIASPTAIYGFSYTEDRKNYQVVPEKMAVVERIIREVAEGTPLYTVKKGLERSGIPSPRGRLTWQLKTLREIVKEDAYRPLPYSELAPKLSAEARGRLDPEGEYGVVWYPKRRIRKLDPDPKRGYRRSQSVSPNPREKQIPIPVVPSGIPREVIDAAREALSHNRVSRSKGHRIYELAGFLRCGYCNNVMATNSKQDGERTYYYYRCPRYQRDGLVGCSMNRALRAEETEREVLHAVLDAVKDRDELIRKAEEDFESARRRLLRPGSDVGRLHKRLEEIERERMEFFRHSARGRLDDAQLDALTSELDSEKALIEQTVTEHENREKKVKELEERRNKAIELIQAGRWAELGITAPERRKERYWEIGLEAKARQDRTVEVSWFMGTKEVAY